MRVPYGQTVHGEEEIAAVVDVLRTSTQMGRNVGEFERRVADLFAKRHGVMVNSGSSANYLAVELLGLPEGSEVITPALTFATTVAPLVKAGLRPAFVDVEPDTFNIDADRIESMLSPGTAALMIPSLIGNLPDWDAIAELARAHDLLVIEDSADTLGATLRGFSTGTRSDISTTSFYGSHVINCAGNGGMLCVNRDEWLEEAKLLRSWGRSSSLLADSESIENRFNVDVGGIEYDAKFVFSRIGYNLEPSEMGAAFGLVQLDRLDANVDARASNFARQLDFFKRYEDWFVLPRQRDESRTGWLAFPLIVRPSAPFTRRDLQIHFEQQDIQTRTVFTGNVVRQPAFESVDRRDAPDGYPNADAVMRGGMLLACHHGLEPVQLDFVHEQFEAFAGAARITVRIAFNGHRLAGQRLGVGRYIEYMLRYWSDMLREGEEVLVYLRQPLDSEARDYLRLSDQIRTQVLGPDMPGILWENLRLRGAAARDDVLFCPAYTAPIGYRHPMVVATHSVNEVDPAAHTWRYRQTYGRLYGHSARSADAVIVPAQSTSENVQKLLSVPEDRIHVVPQGVDDGFVPLDDAALLTATRKRFFGDDRPYVLFVGKCSTRRNIPLLLQAFARVRRAGFPHGLVLFGPNVSDLPLDELTETLGITDDVVQTDGKVTDHHELVAIYNAADVFVHPSLYEGWSMTTVEALACGTAVIAADRGGLAEAVAGHGLMLADLNEDALTDAIRQVLGDADLRRDLERRAYERGRTLRWHQTAELTLDVIRAVGEQ